MKTTESYAGQMWRFAWSTLLPAVPCLAWWTLGLLGFSWLNLLLLDELWPHYPRAEAWLAAGLMISLAPLPWLAAYTAGRVRQRVKGWWWRSFWWLVALGAYMGSTILFLIIFFCLFISL